MAITKAQQARQMLIKGGVVHSDGRRGFFVGAEKDAREGRGDISPGTDRQGNQRDNDPRRGGAGPNIKPTSTKPKAPPGRPEKGSAPKINRFELAEKNRKAKEEKERKERFLEEQRRKQQLQKTGIANTSKFGSPKGTFRDAGSKTYGPFSLKDIKIAESVIEDDDEDDAATAKEIVEQNPLEKFLSNIPSTTGIIGSILEEIPGKSLSEMYDTYGKTDKFKSRFPGIDTFEEYQQAVLDGKISAKGGLMGGFTPGGVQTTKDGTIQLFQGGQDNPPIPPMTTGSVLGSTDFKKAEVDDRTELEKLLAARGDAFRFFADGGMADDDNLVGGIMDLESGRQMYKLGKLVKSVTKGIKNIVKSPIGKAAILGAVGFGIPGTQFGGLFGTATKKGILGKYGLGQTLGIMGKSPQALGGKTPGLGALLQRTLGFVKDKPLTSIFGASILAGLTPQEKQKLLEQEEEEGLDIAAIRGGEPYRLLAEGGRVGLKDGLFPFPMKKDGFSISPDFDELTEEQKIYVEGMKALERKRQNRLKKILENIEKSKPEDERFLRPVPMPDRSISTTGIKSLAEGGKAEPVAKKTMPLLDMNGMEKDYRETGGFVEMGRMERADDVPARLSKNEFVFTADAVRNAGDGNIDKGAEVMYNMMKNLEAGGEVSEESQGLEGARKMFQTSQRLGEVI